jgi:hypothetical protein
MMRVDYCLDGKSSIELDRLTEHFEGLMRANESRLESNRMDTEALAVACRVILWEREKV